jgi:hypothetical protein
MKIYYLLFSFLCLFILTVGLTAYTIDTKIDAEHVDHLSPTVQKVLSGPDATERLELEGSLIKQAEKNQSGDIIHNYKKAVHMGDESSVWGKEEAMKHR